MHFSFDPYYQKEKSDNNKIAKFLGIKQNNTTSRSGFLAEFEIELLRIRWKQESSV
jgi:hypothetical protein